MLTACGVAFSDAPQGNEFWSALTVTGDHHVGQPLTAAVSYKQSYTIAVPIKCELRQSKNLVKPIGEATIPADPGGSPKATPFPGNFSFDFSVDAPGEYRVDCFTAADEDNFISKTFTIGQ